jgi:transglutaminase-like putative cysteine protease
MSEDLSPYLAATWYVDSEAPQIATLARAIVERASDEVDRACRLFYAVRDGIRYTAYSLDLQRDAFRASSVLRAGTSWCVPKSVLLAAMCRAVGIACRLGYANVRNHMATQKLRESMGTNVFYYHGYNEIHVRGRWVKATVAFNRSLCAKARLGTLDFDGVHDSIYHPFDLDGQRHMEYLHDYGPFADVPYEAIMQTFAQHYPRMRKSLATGSTTNDRAAVASDFEADVQAENAGR